MIAAVEEELVLYRLARAMPLRRRRRHKERVLFEVMAGALERRRTKAARPMIENGAPRINASTSTGQVDEFDELDDRPDSLADRLDRAVGAPSRIFTVEEVAAASGMDIDQIVELRRAMGLPDSSVTGPRFSESDVSVLKAVDGVLDSGVVTFDEILAIARITGTAMAHIAEAQIDAFLGSELWARVLSGGSDEAPRSGPDEDASNNGDSLEDFDRLLSLDADELSDIVRALVPPLEESLVFMWRQHLNAILRRTLGAQTLRDTTSAVGFVDVVGYTERSRKLSVDELDELLREFDHLSYECVSIGGGRVIKMIGDEVMYEAPTVVDACRIALALVSAAAANDKVGATRAAVASGSMFARAGDRFGPAVNLASRLTDAAYPGALLIPSSIASQLAGEATMECRPLRNPMRLKGIGSVRATVVRPVSVSSDGVSHAAGSHTS